MVSHQSSDNLRDYFQRQLEVLRDDASGFGLDHPEIARELGLSGGESSDPHVELLLQSFAYLSGRLRYQMDREKDRLAIGVMEQIYPSLTSSVPSAVVAQASVKVDGKNFDNGAVVERGRTFSTRIPIGQGKTIHCRFQSASSVPLWPLSVERLYLEPVSRISQDGLGKGSQSSTRTALIAKVQAASGVTVSSLPLKNLRFYIDGKEDLSFRLFDHLLSDLHSIQVRSPGGEVNQSLSPSQLSWCGFEEGEAALPDGRGEDIGYRLLREYFSFPEKFLFFELNGLDLSSTEDSFDIAFVFNASIGETKHLDSGLLKTNCIPLVNRFYRPMEPMRFDRSHYESRMPSSA